MTVMQEGRTRTAAIEQSAPEPADGFLDTLDHLTGFAVRGLPAPLFASF